MSLRYCQRLWVVSLGFSLLLSVAWGIFVYQVSPLREPNFQPNAANAGSLVPWLSGVTENHWRLGAKILALLLSTNIAFIFAQQMRANQNAWLVRFIATIGIWVILFGTFWLVFLTYLLTQWLVD